MNPILIIADDLTGAADTGVQFCPFYERTVLVSHMQLSGKDKADTAFIKQGATALYTNSRALAPKAARERLGSVARRLSEFGPLWIYKKMDSCLRGNPGAETEALMDEMAYEASFIAPAFPGMGRTTVNGTHLVHGIPVGETEISRDPVAPVIESDLATVIQNQCRYPVGCVRLNLLEAEEASLQDEIERQIGKGARHITFDATRQEHLDRIARLAFKSPHRILPAGSAGLAAGLGSVLPSGSMRISHDLCPPESGNHLLVCGTNSEVTRRQIKTFLEVYPYEEIALDPKMLGTEDEGEYFLNRVASVRSKLAANHLIVTIGSSPESRVSDRQGSRQQAAQSLIEGLGRFLSAVLVQTRPGLLFLTGGDTADAVLNGIGAEGIRILGEVVTGMVQGKIIGGPLHWLPVVTKAGAFGQNDALVTLHETLQGNRQPMERRTTKDEC